SREYCLYNYV
ncbi:phosphate transporter family protein, partial [Chlamydia psittaci 03DC29]